MLQNKEVFFCVRVCVCMHMCAVCHTEERGGGHLDPLSESFTLILHVHHTNTQRHISSYLVRCELSKNGNKGGLVMQVSMKRFLKGNLAHVGMAQCMSALADKVQKQEVPCTIPT